MRAALLAALLAAPGGCRRQTPCAVAEAGCRVVFAYKASADGREVDAAPREAPAELRLGQGGAVAGLEDGLTGARAGEKRGFAVAPAKAFGERDEAAVQDLPVALFASMGKLAPGMSVQGLREGRAASGRVVSVSSSAVRLDFNHPLAGKTLVYDVEILRVER